MGWSEGGRGQGWALGGAGWKRRMRRRWLMGWIEGVWREGRLWVRTDWCGCHRGLRRGTALLFDSQLSDRPWWPRSPRPPPLRMMWVSFKRRHGHLSKQAEYSAGPTDPPCGSVRGMEMRFCTFFVLLLRHTERRNHYFVYWLERLYTTQELRADIWPDFCLNWCL